MTWMNSLFLWLRPVSTDESTQVSYETVLRAKSNLDRIAVEHDATQRLLVNTLKDVNGRMNGH